MSAHRYPPRVLVGDFLRAGIGLFLSAGASALAGFTGFIGWLFGVCAVIFFAFGLRTALRAVTNYELTDTGLTRSYATGIGRAERTLAWQGLKQLRLRFFPAKRDRSQGWMELTLADEGVRMRLDSTLGDFDAILRMAVGAAAQRGVTLSDSTLGNLAALGIAMNQADGGHGAGRSPPTESARR
ncbi:MAG: hypothetical protein KIT16_20060 [Rhodospirillaceae bacterium]|nr:hypothetical protein [Rhodospirillaceae bacterium]